MASATLQISVGGDKEPVDSEIYLLPSEELILDIWTDTAITPGAGEGFWALVVQPAEGSISGGVSLITEESGIAIYPGPVPASPLVGADGVWGTIALATISSIAADTTIYDGMTFHCEDMVDATVALYFGPAIGAWTTMVDSVVIHQPEPMTVALLGLGGLFLRRRK